MALGDLSEACHLGTDQSKGREQDCGIKGGTVAPGTGDSVCKGPASGVCEVRSNMGKTAHVPGKRWDGGEVGRGGQRPAGAGPAGRGGGLQMHSGCGRASEGLRQETTCSALCLKRIIPCALFP